MQSGGDDGIRTHDPYVANVVLSQLSYIPIFKYPCAQPIASTIKAMASQQKRIVSQHKGQFYDSDEIGSRITAVP